MTDLSLEAFSDWALPSDVIDHFPYLNDDDARNYVASLLSDGLLRAAAEQLIVNGHDLGLALVPREAWPIAARSNGWITGHFRVTLSPSKSISAYGVRIDRDFQQLSMAAATPRFLPPLRPLSESDLNAWATIFFDANPAATEAEARGSLNATFPRLSVSRERLRRIMPRRPRGRPLKDRR